MKIGTLIAGIGCVAIIAAACGTSGSATPGATSASAAPASAAPASVAAPSLAAGPVTLTVMQWGNQGDAWWNQRVADFTKKYPNVTIKFDVVPYGQYADKLGAYRTAGSGPDVMQMTAGGYMLGFADMLLPLNGLVDLSGYNAVEAGCQDYDCTKTIYGIPWAAQGHPLYYNKAVLTAAGLDPANPPKTWKDMDAACTKIEAVGKACIAAGPKDYGGLTETAGALLNQTASAEQCKGLHAGTTHGTDPWMVNAFALWADMVKRGWFQKGVADANLAPEAQDLFTGGGSGFYTGLMGDAYDWKVLGKVLGDNLGVYIGPQIEQDFPLAGVGPGPLSTSLDAAGGTVFTVAKSTKAPGEAVAFAKFMTGSETAVAVTDAGSYPASKTFDSASIGSKALDQIVVLAGQSKGACWQYLDSQVFDAVIAQDQLLVAGKTTPAKAGQAVEDGLKDVRP
jgi:ABC-type glycerol-3-phosphate transport system substrate-binding protein